ncbi:MAG: DUF4340 domain-containing protein [Gemmobacter sp.]|nr:DUF4340 domain-containing protein [Gemmobacter sp.]
MKVSRFVTSRADRLARLGFDGDLIELRGTDAKPLLTLHLGKNADSGGFIKLNDEPKAYLVDFSAWLRHHREELGQQPTARRERRRHRVNWAPFCRWPRLTAKHSKTGTSWTADELPEGKELKSSSIDSLVSQLTSLRFTDTTEPTASTPSPRRSTRRRPS